MRVNFLESFKEYLLGKIGLDNKDYETVKNQDASLFYLYANDLKEYVSKNADLSIFSEGFDIGDLATLSINDGKLSAPEDNENLSIFSEYFNGLMQNDTFKKSMDYDNNGEFTMEDFEAYLKEADLDASNTFDINEILTSFNSKVPETEKEELPEEVQKALDDFYAKEEVIKALDIDGDGKLSDEEKAKFEKYLKECFEDGITVENLNKALKEIQDGTFSYDKKIGETKPPETPETPQTEQPQETQQPQSTGGPDGGGDVPPSDGGGDKPKTDGDDSSDDKPLDLSSMTLEQLNSEKTTREAALKEKQDKLGELQSGGGELAELKKGVDDAFEAMTKAIEEVDADLAKALQDKQKEITAQEQAIAQKEAEITSQEGVVADAKTTWDNAKSKTENLKASKSELESVDTSEYTEEQKQALQTKIDELDGEITAAEDAERDAETAYNEANDALDKLKSNEDGSGLEQLQEALDKLNSDEEGQMGDLQKKITELKNDDIDALKQKYDEAKQTYETQKTQLIATAQDEVKKAQEAVDEVNVAIQDYNNKEDKNKFKNPVSKFNIDIEEKMTANQESNFNSFKEHYAKYYDKYQELAQQTSYPAELIAAIHWRESSGDFNRNLQEGGSLDKYGSFENSAKQALSSSYGEIDPDDVQTWLDYAEHYNGMGYTNNGYGPSPYVWAGTSKYTSGKYVRDHVYSADAVDDQIGVAMMLKWALEYKKP